ncbi:MAG: sugar phosphate isomerase/epimerase [Candidatus Bathyarchaeota archaeon]|nr:sugar phosphate isomerase/epimerase [Candidatus Bathyarchaeota archaeon]
MRFSICNELFENWSLEKVFEYVAALGYDGVEIAPFTLAKSVDEIGGSARRRMRELAKHRGLTIAGIHWVMKGPEGLHLTNVNPEIRLRTKNYLKKLVRFCGDIGGKVIVFGSPDQRTVPPEADFEEAWNWAVDSFHECSVHAAEYDVTICIEPLRREATNFINTVDEALALIKDVNHQNFRLILDAYALSGEKESIDSLIAKGGEHLEHFHANDDKGRGPGFGSVDYRKISNALKNVGFKGFVSVEVLTRERDPENVAKLSIENLRRYFA